MSIEMPDQEIKEGNLEERENRESGEELEEKDKIIDSETEKNLTQLLENDSGKNKDQFEKTAKQFEENMFVQNSEKSSYLDYNLKEGTQKLFQKLGSFFKNEKTENEKISQENPDNQETIGQKINFPGA